MVRTLDFTLLEQRDCEWIAADGTRYRFLDRSTGTGFHEFGYDEHGVGRWLWAGVTIYLGGPFCQVVGPDELGDDADWDEGWVIEA